MSGKRFTAGFLASLIGLSLSLGCASAPVPAEKPSSAANSLRSTGAVGPENEPLSATNLSYWGSTVYAAAKGNLTTIQEWWQQDDLASSGFLPYVLDVTPALEYGGVEPAPAGRLTIGSRGTEIRFVHAATTSREFKWQSPRPSTMRVGARDLPVITPENPLPNAPQPYATLAGIASAYMYIDDLQTIQPGCIREQLHWVVPPATRSALAVIGPITVRKAPAGHVAFLFNFNNEETAIIAYSRQVAHGQRMSGMLTMKPGQPHLLIKDDPRLWPILVDSLEEL